MLRNTGRSLNSRQIQEFRGYLPNIGLTTVRMMKIRYVLFACANTKKKRSLSACRVNTSTIKIVLALGVPITYDALSVILISSQLPVRKPRTNREASNRNANEIDDFGSSFLKGIKEIK